MALQKRIHTNGHHHSPNQATLDDVSRKPTISARDVENFAKQHPGSVLIAGLVTGGIVGWLTLKLNR